MSSAPASTADPTVPPVVSGRVAQRGDDWLLLQIPGTSYKLRLMVEVQLEAAAGDKVTGTLHASARRIDVITAGGRYVEPVTGRPRRLQGRVVGGHVGGGLLFVNTGVPFVCSLTDGRQAVSDFEIGQLVSFDVEAGTVFKPAR